MLSFKPNYHFKFPCIQFNFEKSWYNYISFNLFFPYIENIKTIEENTETNVLSFNAPTSIQFVKSNKHYGFKFIIFGFGIGFLRQWIY